MSFISGGTNANIGSTSTGLITAGQWTHVAFVLNNGVGYLYVNGSQVGTGSLSTVNTPSTSTLDLRIGQRVTGGSILFDGSIDEVRVWNVARTSTQIANNRNAEFCSVPANLVAYYTCNQGIAGGNNSNLTNLHNAVLNANGTLNSFSLSGSSSNWVSGAPITAGLTVSKNQEEVCDSLVSPSGLYTWTLSGNYYDTLSNANTCDSIMRFNLTVNNSIYEIWTDTSCTPYVSPSGNYNYTTSGTYFDTTLTSKGCLHVHELRLEINIIDTSVSKSVNTLTSNQANASYTWLDCNDNYSVISGANGQSFLPSVDGDYAARIVIGDCVDTTDCTGVYFIGLAENISKTELLVYPNPAYETLNVSTSGEDYNLDYKIISSIGEVVHQGKLEGQNDVSALESGLNWIRIIGDGEMVTRPFLKQ